MRLRIAGCGLLLATSAAAQTHVIIVTGASGERGYATSFHAAGSALVDALVTKHGLTADDVIYLAEDPAKDRSASTGSRANSS